MTRRDVSEQVGPVPPGSGWPGDLATAATPVAGDAAEVRQLAADAPTLDELTARVTACRACPRLVDWREAVARERRAAFRTEPYWGRPIGGWGPTDASIAVVGLAPAAHGGNRTGRIFTGDRSGDWLCAAMHRAGLARQPTSVHADDGQQLLGTRVLAVVRCAPPANKPTPAERDTCRPWLTAELTALRPTLRAVVVLGGYAWSALWPALGAAGYEIPLRRPAFGHRVRTHLPATGPDGGTPVTLLGCYHPSQQNTFTGRLTAAMLDDVFADAGRVVRSPTGHTGHAGRTG
ncbi:MAG: uracil-DNA glycosylase [Frankiaceae bacterium]